MKRIGRACAASRVMHSDGAKAAHAFALLWFRTPRYPIVILKTGNCLESDFILL